MTDENKNLSAESAGPEKIKLTIISKQELIDVKISGHFLNRAQKLLMTMCGEVGEKETLAIFERLKDNKPPQSSHEEAIILLLSIVDGIENAALEQNKTTIKEYTAEEAIKLFQNQNMDDVT